ncbi:MAG TPA: head GIN domain-containing protein [Cyclobacteriaceae bacterium]
MKKFILFTAFVLTASIVSSGQVTKKTLELPEFKSIYNNSNYTVYLKQTNKQEVVVEALADIYELTNVIVENGVLMINVERKPDNQNKSVWAKIDDIKVNPTMKVYVSVKNLTDLQVNGNGKIISENSIAATVLTLSVSGSGSMDLDLKGDIVKTEVSGSGKISLKGYATSIDAVLSGSGDLLAFNCPLESAKIKVSGTGEAELNVTNTIDAIVLGSGTIKHKGNTKSTTKKVYGSGSIERAY